MTEYILITGGLGYIGSHIANTLLKSGKRVILVDYKENEILLQNWQDFLQNQSLIVMHEDISSNIHQLRLNLTNYKISGVIHCAALKSVPKSIDEPLIYYKNNINSMLNLLDLMNEMNIKTFIYSSSATVYSGRTSNNGIFHESDVSFPTTPYGNTKLFGEKILEDVFISDRSWKIISLRYFNPAVCYLDVDQGDTGLFTAVHKVLRKELPYLSIFGSDYDTHDGSCIRDYIHIDDLVDSHINALDFLISHEDGLYEAINIGTGTGYSTLEVAKEFKKLTNDFEYKIVDKRFGDSAVSVANCDKAKMVLNWTAKYSLHNICYDIVKNLMSLEKK